MRWAGVSCSTSSMRREEAAARTAAFSALEIIVTEKSTCVM